SCVYTLSLHDALPIFVFAALSTLLQLYAQKIKLGSGLPVIIGVSFAYVPTMTAIAAQAKDVNTIFGAMIIGGVVAILVGLFIRQDRKSTRLNSSHVSI